MNAPALSLVLDRKGKTPLSEQIRNGVAHAIITRALPSGSRLPSWRALAAQLGVSRGTVRAAYERLQDEQLIVADGTRGTRVADGPIRSSVDRSATVSEQDLPEAYRDFSSAPGIFQMGVPPKDCFPAKLFTRIRARAIRSEIAGPNVYPDPRGEFELRREIAAHLALSRSMQCTPEQILITAGFTGALGLLLSVLRLEGQQVLLENPSFPLTRRGLEIAGAVVVPVPVDEEGMDVDAGLTLAPDAAAVLVTPGQQAPLGPTLTLRRRIALINWARTHDRWIIEDDYLGELQLQSRAAPALASLDAAGNVIHVGSFSKTVSPALRLGFIVAPHRIVGLLVDAATCLAPAPGPAVQEALAEFMHDGHYFRHLRRLKRFYLDRLNLLNTVVQSRGYSAKAAGLSILMDIPRSTDTIIARDASAFGLTPTPLSIWYDRSTTARTGLLLGLSTVPDKRLNDSFDRLSQIIDRHSNVGGTN